jgi:hypothetical protein
MTILVILFAVLTLAAGLVISINPEYVFGFLRNHFERIELYILAIGVRLLLGVLLIYLSGVSRFPLAIEIIGWISIIAALVFLVIGRAKFNKLMSWVLSLVKPLGRVGGVIAMAFGVFLVYAFV